MRKNKAGVKLRPYGFYQYVVGLLVALGMVGQELSQTDIGEWVFQQTQDGAEWTSNNIGTVLCALNNV